MKVDVLKAPVISEKSLKDAALGVYTFVVDRKANKVAIAKAVADQFKVQVVSVRTLNVPPKPRRYGRKRVEFYKPGYKKAYVKLAPGQKISLFEEEKGYATKSS